MKFGVTVHTVVKNEEQWIWYALQSVIGYVDKIIVYDTGSKDTTRDIIKSIKSHKIFFSEKGRVTPGELIQLRNDQLRQTKTDWFMLLDGDEVWSEAGMKEALAKINSASKNITALISRSLIPLGDLFHYQGESAGRYFIKGKKGHYNIRFYRIKKEYHWQGIYPLEAYVDRKGIPVQAISEEIEFLKVPYWHMTHLKRSAFGTRKKGKLETGRYLKLELPQVFYKDRPPSIVSPWMKFSTTEQVLANILTPLLKLKRKIVIK